MLLSLERANAKALLFTRLIATFLKFFYFFLNRIARYAQSKESRNFPKKIPQITCKAIFRNCLYFATMRVAKRKCHSYDPKLPYFWPVTMALLTSKPHGFIMRTCSINHLRKDSYVICWFRLLLLCQLFFSSKQWQLKFSWIKFILLDVTLIFLDVIVVKREGKYKKFRSFVPKHRIFYPKRSDLLPQNIRSFYAKGKGK